MVFTGLHETNKLGCFVQLLFNEVNDEHEDMINDSILIRTKCIAVYFDVAHQYSSCVHREHMDAPR